MGLSDGDPSKDPVDDKEDRMKMYANIGCSFCGRSRTEVRCMIAGPNVYICDECVTLCVGIFKEEKGIDIFEEVAKLGKKVLDHVKEKIEPDGEVKDAQSTP